MIVNDRILVRALLKEKGMTIKELAKKCHTLPNKIERILVGKDENKTLEDRIFKCLNKK